MADRLQPKDVQTIEGVRYSLRLPSRVSLGIENGAVVPRTPFLFHEGNFYADPSFLNLNGRAEKVGNSWQTLISAIRHLTNPFVPKSTLGQGNGISAIQAVLAGDYIAQEAPDIRVILPPSISLYPAYTSPKAIETPSGWFRYNAWVPKIPTVGLPDNAFGRVIKVSFSSPLQTRATKPLSIHFDQLSDLLTKTM